jgi:hypothetical protein
VRFSSVLLVSLAGLLAGLCGAAVTDTPDSSEPADSQRAEGFVSVSVDDDYGCAMRDDGSLRCWGWELPRPSPSERFSAVSVGGTVACAVRVGGELHCFGSADGGLLSPPEGLFSSVDVGRGEACGVRVDGGLVCWGGEAERWSVPEGVFTTVDVSPVSVCAVRVDGAAVCGPGDYFHAGTVREGPFVTVSVGGNSRSWGTYACGVLISGAVECWDEFYDWYGADPAWWSPPGGVFVDVAVSSYFACGVRAGGEVACWGLRESQYCGESYYCKGWGEDPVPVGPFRAISVGPGYAWGGETLCGVRLDGEVRCWNDGTPRERPPVGEFAAIDAGWATCGLRPGGAAVCWGARVDWLGDVPGGEFTAVRGARRHGCGLRPGGEVECWGDNTWGAATPPPGRFVAVAVGGRVSCGLRVGGEVECWGYRDGGAEPPPGQFTAIEVRAWPDDAVRCGLRADRSAVCWTSWRDVEPGDAFAEPDFTDPAWRGTHPGGTFEVISTWNHNACGIRPDRTVECWSPSLPPGAGVPDPETPLGGSAMPVREPRRGVPGRLAWVDGDLPGGSYVALASGWYYTCGIHPDRTVTCHGATTASPDGEFTAIHVGDYYRGCGLRPGGEVACWHLKNGHAAPEPDFSLAPTEYVITSTEHVITFGKQHEGFCTLVDSGEVVCLSYAYDPPRVERRPGPYSQISFGGGLVVKYLAPHPSEESRHACAIDPSGRLECWGDNDSGQTALPPRWLDDPPYRAVAAGFAHSCAIGASGAVVCWGDDRHEQTQSPPGEFTALGAGQWHTCGLRSDGEAVCWGDGLAGIDQEFDAPPPERPTEAPPGPYTSLAVGQWHTCGLRPDGTATCWFNY